MARYKPSIFNLAVPIKNGAHGFIAVYNTLNRSHVLMPTDQWHLITAGAGGDPDIISQLAAQGILVKQHIDEAILFNHWKARLIHDFSSLRSKVLVSRQCNLRCTYCIIQKEPKAMTPETARAMDAYYLERIKTKKPQQVWDDFLGGEPLLNPAVILSSATRRYYFCKGRGIDYRFFITTNGTLITPAAIAQLKQVGLAAVRVSLAGPATVHDKLRPWKAGGGSTYTTIVRNLAAITPLIPIHIEYQYDAGSDDYQYLPEMLDDLSRHRIAIDQIAFTPILARRHGNRFCSGVGNVDKFLFLNRTAARYGCTPPEGPPSNACMADFRSTLVFDTDGSLIPCPALQAGERGYGNINDGIDFQAESQLLNRRLPDKCLQQCELLPLCMGGCRLQALTHTGDFHGSDCHYDTYHRLLEVYIQDIVQDTLSTQNVTQEEYGGQSKQPIQHAVPFGTT